MGVPKNVAFLTPPVSLSTTGLEAASTIYSEWSSGSQPTTLMVSPTDVYEAYRIMPDLQWKPLIVVVPDLPRGWWGVTGMHGMVWSDF